MRAPIIVMSFDRPQFLEPVIASLKAQQPAGIGEREIHLFQDGAINRYSRIRYAQDENISASVALFRREFPDGIVHQSPDNIGVCENFRRAEHYIFEERGFECAWFFEDDMVLSPAYFQMMERLQNYANGAGNIAYFAAYGNYYAPPDEIADRRRELMTLDHHWAFGLFRRHWMTMQPQLQPFYDIILGNDYSRRDHRAVFALYQALDAAPRASSQDAAKAFACDRLDLWRCNTVVPFAKYIGTSGQHMTPEMFKSLGFDRAVVSARPLRDIEYPRPARVAELITEQRNLFRQIRSDEITTIVASLPARKYSPVRTCDREDVIFAYRLFLNRDPESETVIEPRVGRQTVLRLVEGIANSIEHEEKVAVSAGKPCDRNDVAYAYRLCLHREPDSEQVIDAHVGKRGTMEFTQGIWEGAERVKLWDRIVGM